MRGQRWTSRPAINDSGSSSPAGSGTIVTTDDAHPAALIASSMTVRHSWNGFISTGILTVRVPSTQLLNFGASHFGHEPWLDLDATYTYREVAGPVLAEWNRQYVDGRPRPIFLIESGYECESNDQRAGTPFRVRRQAYAAVLSGALAGHAYGHRELWRFSDRWREAVSDTGSRHMAHVKALFASRSWWKLVPDQKNEFVTAGRGEPGKDDYVTAACAIDNTFAIAYLPSPHRLTLNLGRLARPTVDMFWFDPTSGQMTPAVGKHPQNLGEATFFKQDKNAAGDTDWVLLAEPR